MSRVRQNIIANFAGRGWTVLIALAFVPIYLRFLGIEAYGLIGIYTTITVLAGPMDLGLTMTLNRELARRSAHPDKAHEMSDFVRTLEVVYWFAALALGAAVVGASSYVTHNWVRIEHLSPGSVRNSIILMGFALALQWPERLYTGGLLGLQRQVLLNVLRSGFMTLRAVGAALVLWLVSPTPEAFFAWQLVIAATHVIVVRAYLLRCLPGATRLARFRKKLLKQVWRFSAGLSWISVTGVLLGYTDKIILSKVLTLEMFGYYMLAWTVASGLYNLVLPVSTSVFPRFSQLVALGHSAELTRVYHASCQLGSVLLIPVTIFIAAFPEELLFLWTQDHVTTVNAAPILRLLIVGTALNALVSLPYNMQLAHGWARLCASVNTMAVVLLVPLTIYLAGRYGAIGGAIAWVILNLGYFMALVLPMHLRLLKGEQWRWYFVDVGQPLLAAGLITAAWRALVEESLEPLVQLLLLGLALSTGVAAAAAAAPEVRRRLFTFLGSWVANRP